MDTDQQKKMNEFATTVLWVTSLMLPALIFYAGGVSRSTAAVLIRIFLAIGSGWIFIVAYAQSAQFFSQKPFNGAALAFASIFGWILPAAVVSFCLLIRWCIIRRNQYKISEQAVAGTRHPPVPRH